MIKTKKVECTRVVCNMPLFRDIEKIADIENEIAFNYTLKVQKKIMKPND